MRKTHLTLLFTLISVFTFGQTNWNIDKSHSGIKFTTTHMLISEVEGQFNSFDATVVSTSDDFDGAEINFTAEVESVDTGNERRDTHLKSDDFFNAKDFPQITFKGKLVKEGSDYFMIGDFTMRDVTKQVKFKTKYNGSIDGNRGKKAGFKISGVVNRFDYGLKWNSTIEAGGLVVAEDVEITCNVELNESK